MLYTILKADSMVEITRLVNEAILNERLSPLGGIEVVATFNPHIALTQMWYFQSMVRR